MRNAFWISVLAMALLLACSNETPQSNPKKQTSSTSPKPEKLKKKPFFLTNKNAPDFLTKYFNKTDQRTVVLSTKVGDITFQLSDKTPIHSGNFQYLIQEKQYYDSTLFYRVAENFLIQGGDADNFMIRNRKYAIGEYALPQEFVPELFHKPGAVAMCRHYDNENEGLSSSFDFYIVIGEKSSELGLQTLERENKITFNTQQRKVYKTVGGTPHLDHEHTVFGQVTKGMDVVEKISRLPTDSQDWPDENIHITATLK